jgi:hypothetical protein
MWARRANIGGYALRRLPSQGLRRSPDLSFCFQRRQPRLGVGDKLSQPGLGARVFRKPKNGPHPQDAVAEPSHLIFDFFGHATEAIRKSS